jgi:cyclophilin family peptidyl-prolyl cis-trans isomerase/HEAT repeat protein
MKTGNLRKAYFAALVTLVGFMTVSAQRRSSTNSVPTETLIRIIRAEDERRWDDRLSVLLAANSATVRRRAVLAAGRIGDARALPILSKILREDSSSDVRQMAVFAIGEIESPAGADVLIEILKPEPSAKASEVRARAVEALGKIAAALPESEKDRKRILGEAILNTLRPESERQPQPDRLTSLLGLTAVLRARPEGAGPVVIRFLDSTDPRIVSDALNTMARLRMKDGAERVRGLLNNGDMIVRANAARVLGAIEDKQSFDALLGRAFNDYDLRVRVSAIRSLGALKDPRAIEPLLNRGLELVKANLLAKDRQIVANPSTQNELLEVTTALGRVMAPFQGPASNQTEKLAITFFNELRKSVYRSAPEIETTFAHIAPFDYVTDFRKWQPWSALGYVGGQPGEVNRNVVQGLGEIASAKEDKAPHTLDKIKSFVETTLGSWLCVAGGKVQGQCRPPKDLDLSSAIQAYAAFKSASLPEVLRQNLGSKDVMVRATAAELLGSQPPDAANATALIGALQSELPLTEKGELNDAAFQILNALAKQKTPEANQAIKSALDSSDHLIRRRAVALLKANGVGDFSDRIGTVKTRNTEADYRRAIARIGTKVTATLDTTKGSFTIEFLPEAAPLTVDNFVQLARRGYFNRVTFHRVVSNFVIQGGDPRGDGNGGPGYSIRCEVNEVPYERAAVGMALSGKDTGGSQWFVTHSPQPHLDGGYTIFGRVVSGMDVVDNIARGDIIRKVIVNEQ